MPKKELFEIRNSVIHGQGLYAAQDIEKDTWIIQYVGEHISKEESERRSTALIEKTEGSNDARVYVFILNDEVDIDGDVDWNPARLMNHSCEPNVEAQNWQDKEIWFIALRDIKKGEELTFNYGFEADTWEDHPCRCGKPSCVGYIVAEDQWPTLKRKIAAKKAAHTRKLHQKKKNSTTAAKRQRTPSKK